MPDSIVEEVPVAEAPAPDQELPADPDTDETPLPGTGEAEPKTFTQDEVDAFVSKRLDKAERKWARKQAQPDTPKPIDIEGKTVDDFDSVEAYAEALAENKAQEIVAKRDTAEQQSAISEKYHSKVEAAIEKYDDFEQVAYNSNLKITESMAETIRSSDIGPEIIYSLGSNPKEAARISKLPKLMQAKEIGKLEAKLTANPPTKKVSSAPAPINPVTATGNGSQKYDTTDPRSISSMSTSEWIDADRKRQVKKMQG